MSTSQKYKGYSIVPWYNSDEWQDVYKLIYSKESTIDQLKTAFNAISTWQMRSTHLPSGVEGTLCILEALLIDKDEVTDRQYRLLCAASIMRFLNICVAHRAQVYSFTRTVKEHSIPDWIIGIRHDFAHSQKLPSVSILQLALKELSTWLETTYWYPESLKISDNIISGMSTMQNKTGPCSLETYELMGLFCNVFVYDAKNLCYDEFIQDKLELVNASSKISEYPEAILHLLEHGIKDLGDDQWAKCIDEILYSHFYIIHPNTLMDMKGNVNAMYSNLGNLIAFIERHNKLSNLMEELFYLCSEERESCENRIGAAEWLNEMFKGMLKFKKKTTPDLKSGIHFKQLHNGTLNNIKNLKQLVTNVVPESFQKYFINNFSVLIGDKDILTIAKHMNKHLTPCHTDSEDSLKMQQEQVNYYQEVFKILETADDCIVLQNDMDTSEYILPVYDVGSCERWSLIQDTTPFESCAIGVIPSLSAPS